MQFMHVPIVGFLATDPTDDPSIQCETTNPIWSQRVTDFL